jgi:hypothetical protein
MTDLELLTLAETRYRRDGLADTPAHPVRVRIVVWRIRCVFPCTSLVLKISAKSSEDAVHAARRSRFGKHAVEYVVLGSE